METCITLVFKFSLPFSTQPQATILPTYQGIDIFYLHGPTVENVSAQHNEEEKKTQQHVAHIAEDVVEGTAGKKKVLRQRSTAAGG